MTLAEFTKLHFPQRRPIVRGDVGIRTMASSVPVTPRSKAKAKNAARQWLQRQKEAEALFTLFDADANGMLDKDELTALMRQCFPTACRDSAKLVGEAFSRADADGNGYIDFEEFVEFYNKMPAAQARGEWKEAVAVFQHFDTDGSGTIDETEYAGVARKVRSGTAHCVNGCGMGLELLHRAPQVFPDRCDENEAWITEQL
eukprot:5508527-Prymnesium_polylepis.2